jgi:hypothetical protein
MQISKKILVEVESGWGVEVKYTYLGNKNNEQAFDLY